MIPQGARRWLGQFRRFRSSWNGRPIAEYLDPDWHEQTHFIRSQQIVVEVLAARPGPLDVLDVPCGNGRLYRALHATGRPFTYSGLDATPKIVEAARTLYPGIAFQLGDVEALPFPDAAFDVVVMQHLLRHLRSYKRAVRELLRVSHGDVYIVEKGIATGRDHRECFWSPDDQSWFWVNRWAPDKLCAFARANGAATARLINNADTDDRGGQYIYRFTKEAPPLTI